MRCVTLSPRSPRSPSRRLRPRPPRRRRRRRRGSPFSSSRRSSPSRPSERSVFERSASTAGGNSPKAGRSCCSRRGGRRSWRLCSRRSSRRGGRRSPCCSVRGGCSVLAGVGACSAMGCGAGGAGGIAADGTSASGRLRLLPPIPNHDANSSQPLRFFSGFGSAAGGAALTIGAGFGGAAGRCGGAWTSAPNSCASVSQLGFLALSVMKFVSEQMEEGHIPCGP